MCINLLAFRGILHFPSLKEILLTARNFIPTIDASIIKSDFDHNIPGQTFVSVNHHQHPSRYPAEQRAIGKISPSSVI